MAPATLANRNTVILTILSVIHGLSMYGFLGLYPTFLRENLHYSATDAGTVIGFFGIGALTSIGGGWLGDRFSPKLVLSGSLLSIAVLGYLFFQPSLTMLAREILTCIYGIAGSAVLYVNLAGYHVKSLLAKPLRPRFGHVRHQPLRRRRIRRLRCSARLRRLTDGCAPAKLRSRCCAWSARCSALAIRPSEMSL